MRCNALRPRMRRQEHLLFAEDAGAREGKGGTRAGDALDLHQHGCASRSEEDDEWEEDGSGWAGDSSWRC